MGFQAQQWTLQTNLAGIWIYSCIDRLIYSASKGLLHGLTTLTKHLATVKRMHFIFGRRM